MVSHHTKCIYVLFDVAHITKLYHSFDLTFSDLFKYLSSQCMPSVLIVLLQYNYFCQSLWDWSSTQNYNLHWSLCHAVSLILIMSLWHDALTNSLTNDFSTEREKKTMKHIICAHISSESIAISERIMCCRDSLHSNFSNCFRNTDETKVSFVPKVQ